MTTMQQTKQNYTSNKENWKKQNGADLSTVLFERVPPQATEIEEAVLGALMLEGSLFSTVWDILPTSGCFYKPEHQKIYDVIQLLSNKNQPVDLLTVAQELNNRKELESIGGPYGLTKITNCVVSTAHIETHAKIVKEKHLRRKAIAACADIIQSAYDEKNDVFDLLDNGETEFIKLRNNTNLVNIEAADALAMQDMIRMDKMRSNPGYLSGVKVGIKPIDAITRGLQPTDLIILAARPSVGKTSFALNLAINACKHVTVAFFSLEMSKGQLITRAISSECKINLEKILNGACLSDSEYEQYCQAANDIGNLPLFIDDTPALTINDFRSRARKLVHKHNAKFIIIDYLQLMRGGSDGERYREQEISNISRNLKAIAKELQIPIIALSQLSRASEKEKREPQLSDLRESGAIEQDADMVMFLTRPSYQKEDNEVDPEIQHDVDLHIKKHRNGKLCKIPLKAILSIQRWFDLQAYDEYMKVF